MNFINLKNHTGGWRDIVRTAVVKTNPYWPFSSLNRMPYHLAVKAFIRLCKRFPEVKSIYLRHGLTEGNWVPALSDVDLTIITDSKLTIDEEFHFLHSFWKNYDRLKKLFPMLGEIEILNEEHIGSWTKFNVRGYESRNWRLIYGRETVKSYYVVDPARLATDSLNHALWVYLDFFLRRFYRQECPSYLISQEMQRLAFKILRYTRCFDVHTEKQKVDGWVGDKADMLCYILKELEEGIRRFTPFNNTVGSRKNAKEWLDDVESRNVSLQDQASDTKELVPFHEAIESIFPGYDRNIIVLKGGLDASVMRECINITSRVLAGQKTAPVIVSLRVFEYMLRFYNPFLYTHLIRNRKAAHDEDLLSNIQPPDMFLFINKVLEQIPTVLTYSQSYKLISPPNPNWFSGREFESIVERSLFIKLYLEKGGIRPWYHELLAECQEHYPEYYKKLRELQKKTDCVREKTLSLESFKLLRGMVKDIHDRLTNSNTVENLFLERSE